jgi:Ca-activated chloride channel family protein
MMVLNARPRLINFTGKRRPIRRDRNLRRQGSIMAMVAFTLPMLIILAAFVVNFAYIELTRTQALIASDAATRAGGRTFSLTGDIALARIKAREAAKLNPVAGKALELKDSAFVLGASTRTKATERFKFQPNTTPANALRITVTRNADNGGAVDHIFANILEERSFTLTRSSISTRVEVDIAFVVDRSGSMAYAADQVANLKYLPKSAPPTWKFGQPAPTASRWRDLEKAAQTFLDNLKTSAVDEQVSLVTYGNSASIDRNMTADYNTISSGMSFYTNSYPTGATNIGDGIVKAASALKSGRPFASKVIVLMTDGIATPGLGPDAASEAKKLAEQGVITFTVTFAAEAGQAAMKKVASNGMGLHFHADNAAVLSQVFEKIARTIPTVLTK